MAHEEISIAEEVTEIGSIALVKHSMRTKLALVGKVMSSDDGNSAETLLSTQGSKFGLYT